jgi:3-oxoacyl-[acyl-carrier protein] reductase
MELGLSGRVALVAASSRGLGRACATELAREGASVVVNSRSAPAAEAAAQEIQAETAASVVGVGADLSSESEIARLVEAASAIGPIDILVTNTGPPKSGPLQSLSDADWRAAFELVTLSVVRLLRLVLPGMCDRGWGRVIAIQSTSVRQPIPMLLTSNGIRPGTQGVLRSMVDDVAVAGVTINTVLPGIFQTDRLTADLVERAKRDGNTTEDQLQLAASRNPTRRVGSPMELAALVAFLASERASFINGAAIQVDGGGSRQLA